MEKIKMSQKTSAPKIKGRKRLSLTAIAVILTVSILLSFGLGFLTNHIITQSKKSKLIDVISTIEKEAIFLGTSFDGENMSQDELIKAVVASVLEQDSYAEYFTPSEYKEYRSESSGSYSGIGVNLSETSTKVYSVIGNSPAEIAGIRGGDYINAGKISDGGYLLFSDGKSLMTFLETAPINTPITLKVQKGISSQEQEITVTKGNYKASYIKYYDNSVSLNFISGSGENQYATYQTSTLTGLNDETAMITIQSFYGDMVAQFKSATNYMKKQGKTKLILDLRDNGGGSVGVMLSVSRYLIKNNGNTVTPIMFAKDKQGKYTQYNNSGNEYLNFLTKTVVLANVNTASASECLINAMLYYGNIDNNFSKDNLVISSSSGGATTFGKGIMQKYFEFSDGSALKLTTSKLYAPDKTTCIHGTGITTTESNSLPSSQVFSRALELMA